MYITNKANSLFFFLFAACIIAFNTANGVIEVLCAITFVIAFIVLPKTNLGDTLKSPIILSIGCLWVYIIITSFLSVYWISALGNALPVIRFVAFALAVGWAFYTYKNLLQRSLDFMAFAAFIVSVNAIIQFYIGADLLGNKPLENGALIRLSNLTGKLRVGYVLSIFASIIAGYLIDLIKEKSASKTKIAALFIALITSFTAVLLSGERTPFAMMLGVLTILLITSMKPKYSIIALLCAIVAVTSAIYKNPHLKYRIVDNTAIELSNFFSNSSYGMIYRNAYTVATEHNKFYGSGAKTFTEECNNTDVPFPKYCANHTHHMYLEFLIAGGLPGLLLFTLIVCITYRNFFMHIYNRKKQSFLYIGAASLITLKLLPIMSASSLYIAWSSYPIAFICGIIYSLHLKTKT